MATFASIIQSSDFLLFSCIVYFVYFTNFLRVCILVYLLTINFVRVLIVYFQNIVYYNKLHYQLRKMCTYLLHSMHVQFYSIYFCYFIWICIYLCCLFHIFKCEYRYTVSHAARDQNFLGRGKRENPVMKILLMTGIICNFISTSTLYNRRHFGSSKHKNIFLILGNVNPNF